MRAHKRASARFLSARVAGAAVLWAAGLAFGTLSGAPSLAMSPSQAQAAQPGADASSRPKVVAQKTSGVSPRNGKSSTKPSWQELTPAQQQALAPLSTTWDTVSEAQKRKWLALSRNFPKMSPDEQAKLHSRMTDWVALSPQQRTQARLNFGKTRQLSPDDKKAKWEAYQALSAEEKRKLAAGAPKSPATAAAVKPVTPDKLATVPKPKPRPRQDSKTPRIAVPAPAPLPAEPAN